MADTAPQFVDSSVRSLWPKAVLALVLLAGLVAVILGPTKDWLEHFTTWVLQAGPTGYLVYGAVYVVAALLFVPGGILTIVAGFVFGLWKGFVLVSIASTVGAIVAFGVSRYLAGDMIRGWVEQRPAFVAIYRAIATDDVKVVLLTRLAPILPYNVLNYGFGLTDVSWRRYALASWIGMLPGTFVYVYVGAAAGSLANAFDAEPPGAATYALWAIGAVAIVVGAKILTDRARAELQRVMAEDAAEQPS